MKAERETIGISVNNVYCKQKSNRNNQKYVYILQKEDVYSKTNVRKGMRYVQFDLIKCIYFN